MSDENNRSTINTYCVVFILNIILCVTFYPLIIKTLNIYLPANAISAERVLSLTRWLWFIWIYEMLRKFFKDDIDIGIQISGSIILFVITLFTFYPIFIGTIGDLLLNNSVPISMVKPLRGWIWFFFIIKDITSILLIGD